MAARRDASGAIEFAPGAVYGYCPQCGAPGEMRERRPNGNDRCQRGHKYPSVKATERPGAEEPKAKKVRR